MKLSYETSHVTDPDVMKDALHMADTVRCLDGLVLRRNRDIVHGNLVIALQCDMESHKQGWQSCPTKRLS